MIGNDLTANLGLRLEDPAESVFTKQAKIDSINLAQKTTVNMLDNAYLTELESIAPAESTDSSGLRTFASAGIDPVRGGITGIYSNTASKWCTQIESKDVKRLENSYLAGSSTNPVVYIFNETIYIKPEAITSIDIWYLSSPVDFAITPGTSEQALTVECQLNPALHELVLDFAEAQLWRMDAKPDRAQSAYNNALNLVKVLNDRYQAEKPEGIGTKGR